MILRCSLLVMNGTHSHVPLRHLYVFFSEMFLRGLSFAHVLIGLCILALLIVYLCVCVYVFYIPVLCFIGLSFESSLVCLPGSRS